jgi:hypothetical protein
VQHLRILPSHKIRRRPDRPRLAARSEVGRLPAAAGGATADRARLITRGGYNWASRYPWIAEPAPKNRFKHFVIDGEAIVRGVDGYSDFNTLHSGKENESVELLLAFNILALNGYGVAPFFAEDQSAAAARSSTGRNFPLPAACPLSEFLPSGPRPVLVSLYNAKFFIVYTSHAILGTCPTACAGHCS